MAHNDDDNGCTEMTNQEMLKILLQEIADVRKELKEDIQAVDQKLSQKIDDVDQRLGQKIDNLTLKTDQNQIAFITNLDAVDKRVTTLEVR